VLDLNELEERITRSFFSLFQRVRTPNTIHVSALPFCLRKEFFNVKFNASLQPNERMVRGRICHYVLRELDIFDEDQHIFEQPIELQIDNYRISGKIDVFDHKNKIVYEFKFSERLDSSELDPLYFAQANFYAVYTQSTEFYLVKVHPVTFKCRVLQSVPDQGAYDVMLERAKFIIDCLKNNELPEGPEHEFECKWCMYSVVCNQFKKRKQKQK